ncbi:MAG: BREX-1 system adenine-specific DNA-methyltransferase PglX, partial [Gelidibacter sp.]|nr:BREX-1 system adenine-specific DNA-methyltransferase PglX [Gelidibacter sp.]
ALEELERKDFTNDLFLQPIHQNVIKALTQADYLSQRYHVVIANPPYMGGSNMNGRLGAWLKDQYPDAKSDLFSAFMIRNTELALPRGQLGFMTPFVWMFISSYEKLRHFVLERQTITSLIQLEYSGFDGATVPICTFTLENSQRFDFKGGYIRLTDFKGAKSQAPKTIEAIKNKECGWFYRTTASDLKRIPGTPIAYWLKSLHLFEKATLKDFCISGGRNKTHDNNKYIRLFWEVNFSDPRWVVYANGGDFRKYFGNEDQLVDWSDDARTYYDSHGGLSNQKFWGKTGITWGIITSAINSFRLKRNNAQYSSGGPTIFSNELDVDYTILSYLNSPIAYYYLKAMNPTLNTTVNDVLSLPYFKPENSHIIEENLKNCIDIYEKDWNDFETSLGFTKLDLLKDSHSDNLIENVYKSCRNDWKNQTNIAHDLETQNNRIFIDAYGLQDELTPDVPLEEITLTCNPYYRYGGKNTPEELEAKLLSDTIQEFIHYAVGCMFGRYSIDKPGLILANQGDTIAEYKVQVPNSRFDADEDNVIPILDENWFEDDIVERFQKFLRVTFGEENYKENLEFIENAIGKNLRKYFTKDFYDYHVRRFKKR